ncbi:Holliday junction DNA helicase RuvA [Candidatus Roizmanbacteria bacterium RIFCSPLOWO2_12_FULL_40_12]|uniref:Holliday junction branch migration complex subunit RuvA n=1 Tax=Candidatus Roizmanbacteria bacterium RIFCSPLOWO2_01_FULL_40_42 TaxID=1802066 RepID=A0A1F7J2C5_9BACT|nr:MAG: Holliday junction DNA helicase RuvA [Candidatus Roizmanbacteria bacterium RIFCSPHIGHO2_01_FULL_40_98]OGK27750.1 MAG: Holliday junction DNA helicase RuvA [Candidatus Roizmanbacteria bacterium RIFCSPHIGHO2_02_FULL_40_53]OGK30675.1 MAG: Holliday junction DNA helicase RuvA [Candidatus Roizmanbacteria bacterium RIFCSPHIGHO2_12_41_18]OGK36497.1 MAG: Holliday junction DNA helicase RuvA [Candidatus Roizmanbacteria bacterium RIFCSPHIGHO2_12_FULL_40_130]OGK49759.1 MAG: Holliday junction DNA helic
MIGKIKGNLLELDGNVGLLETKDGISYEVLLPPFFLSQKLNTQIEIYTYLQVRDDAHILFGFENKKQKELFKLLIGISGVGPKTAFSIISFSQEDELVNAVQENSVEYFSKVPGLGKKTAMKIILELSQKFKQEFQLEKMFLSEDDKTVVDVLVSLGYKSKEAKQVLSKIPKNLSVEEKIKEGLRYASSPSK